VDDVYDEGGEVCVDDVWTYVWEAVDVRERVELLGLRYVRLSKLHSIWIGDHLPSRHPWKKLSLTRNNQVFNGNTRGNTTTIFVCSLFIFVNRPIHVLQFDGIWQLQWHFQ